MPLPPYFHSVACAKVTTTVIFREEKKKKKGCKKAVQMIAYAMKKGLVRVA